MSHTTSCLAALLAIGLAVPAVAQESGADSSDSAETASTETGSAESGSAEAPSLDTVVASVNGEEITLGHMLMVRSGLPDQYQQLPDNVLWDGILDQLIQQEVLAQSDMAEETDRVRIALENERRALTASEVVAQLGEGMVTDEKVQEAYDAQFGDADQGQEYNAAHILLETEDEAKAVKEELDGGADFAELAKEKSTGPSAQNGGDLGWFSAGQMVPAFEEAVAGMEPGTVSDPVETQFGWHVIKLNETRAAEAPPLDQVRDQIAQQLEQQGIQAKIDEMIGGAEIERSADEGLDPSVLSDTDLLEE